MNPEFIPPEGAMQFVLNPGPMDDTVPWRLDGHGIKLKRPEYLWVGPGVRCTRKCPCAVSYPVLHEAFEASERRKAEKILALNFRERSFVCGCDGKVIE